MFKDTVFCAAVLLIFLFMCHVWVTGQERPATPPAKLFHKPTRSLEDFLQHAKTKKEEEAQAHKKRKLNKPSEPNTGSPIEESDIALDLEER